MPKWVGMGEYGHPAGFAVMLTVSGCLLLVKRSESYCNNIIVASFSLKNGMNC